MIIDDKETLGEKTESTEKKYPDYCLHSQGILTVTFGATRGLASQCLYDFFHAFHEAGKNGNVPFDIPAALS